MEQLPRWTVPCTSKLITPVRTEMKVKKMMIKTLKDAIDSKYNGSEETDVLLKY